MLLLLLGYLTDWSLGSVICNATPVRLSGTSLWYLSLGSLSGMPLWDPPPVPLSGTSLWHLSLVPLSGTPIGEGDTPEQQWQEPPAAD